MFRFAPPLMLITLLGTAVVAMWLPPPRPSDSDATAPRLNTTTGKWLHLKTEADHALRLTMHYQGEDLLVSTEVTNSTARPLEIPPLSTQTCTFGFLKKKNGIAYLLDYEFGHREGLMPEISKDELPTVEQLWRIPPRSTLVWHFVMPDFKRKYRAAYKFIYQRLDFTYVDSDKSVKTASIESPYTRIPSPHE